MKKYRVNVNGTVYDITLEVLEGEAAKAPAAPAPAPAAAPAPAPAPVAAPVAGGQSVDAPMPGNIISVNVKPGQAVKKGDVLLILEAMKMENEIMAPVAGTVGSVAVKLC